MAGKFDRIILWVLDCGLAHFDLVGSEHVSLRTESNFTRAFTHSGWKATKAGLDAAAGMAWGFRCEKSCRLWLVPLATVSAITWLAPGANTLATTLLYKWVLGGWMSGCMHLANPA
jgi:hypothetical protein